MKKDMINLNYKNLIFFFFFLYASLLVGFYFDEDTTGGAFLDYKGQKSVSQAFAIDFKNTLMNYDNFATRHSPFLIIFLSFFEYFNINDHIIRIIHLNICLALPLIFYLILKEKFKFIRTEYLLLIVGLIFISPTFRSLAIWPDSRLFGLIFFSISILYYLYFVNYKKFNYCLYNIFFCALASYLSPNFSIFSIYFFYGFNKYYKFLSKEILSIILLNLILALPAFYYLFVLEINFLTKTAIIADEKELLFFKNISNQILIIPTIIFFYLFPLVALKLIEIRTSPLKKIIFISLLTFFTCLFFFDYKYSFTGGGIFFKISYYLFNNNYLFFIISLISIIFLGIICNNKFDNFLLFFLLLLNNPQISIYHKYYDPFILILALSIFNFQFNLKKINFHKLKYIYLYFFSFLIISFFK